MKKIFLLTIITLGLTGCGGNASTDPTEEHVHTFSSKWTTNSNYHWHTATCEHTSEKSSYGKHVDKNSDGKCDTCGYTMSGSGGGGGEQKKVTVAAHTLSDSPVSLPSKGEQVSKATWEEMAIPVESDFVNNYNFYYHTTTAGDQTFTKNGYYVNSTAGKIYFERKSGDTFYCYVQEGNEYLRTTTTLDLQAKYCAVFKQEVYVHFYDYDDYTFNTTTGRYEYNQTGLTSIIEIKNGMITYMKTVVSGYEFIIDKSFKATIDIPTSYYYE